MATRITLGSITPPKDDKPAFKPNTPKAKAKPIDWAAIDARQPDTSKSGG